MAHSDDDISVEDAARAVGTTKHGLFKVLKRLSISTFKRKSAEHRGQAISFISHADFEFLANNYTPQSAGGDAKSSTGVATDDGWFYLIQLEPDCDPGRFKLGFAVNLDERLRHHRCAAPYSTILDSWPCLSLWEKTAIDCASQGCEQIHTEVFRTDDIERVRQRCKDFFDLMPAPRVAQQADPADRASRGH